MKIDVEQARPDDAMRVADMAGELLTEIMAVIGERAFGVNPATTTSQARDWLVNGHSVMWLAHDREHREVLGFVAAYECYALYAGGVFGTISELYVRRSYRAQGVGSALLDETRRFASAKGWTRLEVTTPPLPAFDRTVRFYARHGFTVTGGRKMKVALL